MRCRDDSVNFLKNLGYNVVRLPRENFDPLLILAWNGKALDILGEVRELATDRTSPPIVNQQQAAPVEGRRSSKLDASLGLQFLQRFLAALGAGSASVEAAYRKAKNLEFVYDNVLSDSVSALALSSYLRSAIPDINSLLIEQFDEEGEAFVVTEILKSDSFGVMAYDESNKTISVDVDAIKGVLGAKTGIEVSSEDTLKVRYKGNKQLRFGFKAAPFWVQVSDGRGQFRLGKPSGDIGPALSRPADQQGDIANVVFRTDLIRIVDRRASTQQHVAA